MAIPPHNVTPIQQGMDMISELVSYMMAVRSLSTITTDLETDVASQTSIGMVNMALNVNIVPKVVPSPRTMELLLRNFAGAFQYDLTSLSMRPNAVGRSFGGMPSVNPSADPHAGRGANVDHVDHVDHVDRSQSEADGSGGQIDADGNGSQRIRRRTKRPKKLHDFEDPDWSESEGLVDLMNFASEAGSE
jgi:hypothetical protein